MRLFPIIAIVLAAALAGPASAQETVRPVKLMTVNSAPEAATRHFFGNVVARQTVDLAFQVGGQIVEFPAIEGQPVAKDGLIARLDLADFERTVDQALLQKDQADRAVARLKKLGSDTVSQVSIDDAVTQAGLADISVREARLALERATLNAPFDALVAARNVANFSTIGAGTAVARLHDMSELRIEIDVPEILFQTAGENPDVQVFAKFPAGPERYPLEVREFNAEASTVGQTYRLTFGLPPPEGLRILPGSSVTVIAELGSLGIEGIALPATAIALGTDGSPFVYLFEETDGGMGKLSKQAVELQPADDGALIAVSGIEPGMEIVAAGAASLEDGQIVRRFTGFGS